MQLMNQHIFSTTDVAITLHTTDNQAFLSTDGGVVEVYDSQGRHSRTLTGHTGAIWAVATIENRLVSGGTDTTIRTWNLETGECLLMLEGHTNTVRGLKALRTETVVSASRDRTLRIWNISDGKCLRVLEGHTDTVRDIDVDSNGAKIVSGSFDGTARIWDAASGECRHVLRGHTSQIYRVLIHGSKVVTGALDNDVRVWGLDTGTNLGILRGHASLITQLSIIDDGKLISAAADGKIKLWNLDNQEAIYSLDAHDGSVIALTTYSSRMVTGSSDGIQVRHFDDGSFIESIGKPGDAVWAIKRIGEILVAAVARGRSSTVEFWKVEEV